MRLASFIFTIAVVTALPAAAQVSILDDPSLGGSGRYDNCLLLVRSDPQRALNAALDWEKQNGGGAAIHCSAVALVGLRRYAEAAAKLDTLARTTPGSADRGDLYDQAGNAWLLARRPDDALTSFSSALTFHPRDPDLLADRARAYALKTNYQAAEGDLTLALTFAPTRTDLLILRSSARHALGRKQDARADLDQAVTLNPKNAEALELRGEMKMEAGDQNGAKADWQAAMAASPRSASASTAKDRLDQLNQPAPAAPSK